MHSVAMRAGFMTSSSAMNVQARSKSAHSKISMEVLMNLKSLSAAALALALAVPAFAQTPAQPAARPAPGPGLTLTTTAFEDGGVIPVKYTSADPKAVSPESKSTNVPAGTVTFALIFHDPDVALQ